MTPELGLKSSREHIVWVYPLPDNMPACHTTRSSNKNSVMKGHFGISNKGFLNKRSAFQKSERETWKKKDDEKKKCSVQCGFPPREHCGLHLHKLWGLAFCLITMHLLGASERTSKHKSRKKKRLLIEVGPVAPCESWWHSLYFVITSGTYAP